MRGWRALWLRVFHTEIEIKLINFLLFQRLISKFLDSFLPDLPFTTDRAPEGYFFDRAWELNQINRELIKYSSRSLTPLIDKYQLFFFLKFCFQIWSVPKATSSLPQLKKLKPGKLTFRGLAAAFLRRNVRVLWEQAAKATNWTMTIIHITILVKIILLSSGNQVNFIKRCFFQYFWSQV